MVLKPQDVFVVLKIAASGTQRPPYAQLASELQMSVSEVHACVKRATACHLLHGPDGGNRPNLHAVEEFLVHGLQYVFPAERSEPDSWRSCFVRGYAAADPDCAGERTDSGMA